MISKKLLFVFFVLLTVAIVAGLCAWDEGINAAVSNTLLGIGGFVWVSLSGAWAKFTTLVGTPTNLVVYTCSLLVLGGIVFVFLNRAKQSGKLPLTKKVPTEVPLQSGPDVVPGSIIKQPNPIVEETPVAPKEVEVEAS